uniref:Uncharacterized protein n=1 Tax=Panagrolaimus sp. JU765 TaxID=591449 RepID=A0AC34QPV7_9BILA
MAAGDATYCVEDESSIELQDEVEAVSTPVKLEMTAECIKTYLTPTSLAQRRLQDKQLFMDMHEYDIRVNNIKILEVTVLRFSFEAIPQFVVCPIPECIQMVKKTIPHAPKRGIPPKVQTDEPAQINGNRVVLNPN